MPSTTIKTNSKTSSRSSAFTKINSMTDINRLSTLRQINENDHGSNESDEELNKTKKIPSVVVSPIITSTDRTNPKNNSSSTKLFKFSHPQSHSIKMLSNIDGLSSALRVPTKIQLTKTLSAQNENNFKSNHSVEDYPLTPPPPLLNQTSRSHGEQHSSLSKRHSLSFVDRSVPSTSELSPTSLSPDDSLIELDTKLVSSSIKRRCRSLSSSCPILPSCTEITQPITSAYKSKSLTRIFHGTNRKHRSMSPVIRYSSIDRLKRRRRDHQISGKRLKLKPKIEDEEQRSIGNLLNEMIEQIGKNDEHQPNSSEWKRQISTPLSFHSIPSSSTDEPSLHSPSNTHIFTDIVNELIKGAKGLDKLSCSLTSFTNSIHDFIRLNIDKQTEKVEHLQQALEKKCSSQFHRANIFCTKKIHYFLDKHSLISLTEHVNAITLIVKYFYLYVLSLNYRKQENEYESILNDLIHEKYSFINELFTSSVLSTIIEDLILTSSLANEYLSAQPILINQIEYSLPLIRNLEYENELLYKTDLSTNPFAELNDLENYLHCCEHIPPSIPYYPIQQPVYPPVYYPPSGQYYYHHHPQADLTPYYYHHPSPQSYGYHPSAYYHPVSVYHEQYNYYYNQSTSYNSTNDIPNYPSYRRVKNYSNPSLETPVPSNIDPIQSTTSNPLYP